MVINNISDLLTIFKSFQRTYIELALEGKINEAGLLPYTSLLPHDRTSGWGGGGGDVVVR